MILVGLFNILRGKGLSISPVEVVEVVTVATVTVAPFLQAVFPLLNSHHLVERVNVYVHIVSSGNVDHVFSHPVRSVDHVLFGPVYFVIPVADHLPCFVFNLFRSLARFDVDTLGLVDGVSGKSSPVLNILGINKVFAPSYCVVCSPVLARLVN